MAAVANLVGVEIHGGLGNQLFQYAAAYSLAKRRGADLRLDTRLIRRKTAHRPLALDRFGITWTECLDPEAGGLLRAIPRALRLDGNPFRFRAFHEDHLGYMAALDRVELPVFLKGYFQSWRYFADAEDDIRRLFDTAKFVTDRTVAIAASIRNAAEPVMVHVRRGDYVALSQTYELLGREYYEKARQAIDRAIGAKSYFIFSDDATAARSILGDWPNATFISDLSDMEDLSLMAMCRHFIIANSTFSWWAAWLGRRGQGIVVAPRRWLATGESVSLNDLLPEDWRAL